MKKYDGPERRKHPRLDANFIVSYRIQEPPSDFDLSQTRDIGQGGILLTTNKEFEKGTFLAMIIRLPFMADKIDLNGRVVSCEEKIKDLIYETHIEFVSASTNLINQISNFVNKELKND